LGFVPAFWPQPESNNISILDGVCPHAPSINVCHNRLFLKRDHLNKFAKCKINEVSEIFLTFVIFPYNMAKFLIELSEKKKNIMRQ